MRFQKPDPNAQPLETSELEAARRELYAAGERIVQLEAQVADLQAAGSAATLARRANDLTVQVAEFHTAFGYPVQHRPHEPTADEAALRLRLITEEYLELLEAHGAPKAMRDALWQRIAAWVEFQRGGPGFSIDPVETADALGDLDYVVEGTRLTYGIPRQAVANEIQRSNMAKVGSEHDSAGKLQKPAGWTPPDIAGVLAGCK